MMRPVLLAIAALLFAARVSRAQNVCAGPTTTYGIDVSRFQGDINWDQVAGSGVKFAFIQISRSLTDIDAKFEYNWRRAKEVGILRGAYQRFHPGQGVIAQADLFLSKLGPYQAGDLPPVLDVEDADGLGATQIASAVRQWVEYVEQKLGIRPIIYTGFYFWRDSVGGANFANYHLWIANYGATCPLVPPAWTKWTFHQYSSTANVPGITANTCDVNKFNGTLAELQALAKPAEPPKPCGVIDTTEAGSIVDESTACFTAGGDPMYMRHENAGFGSSLQWTHATELAEPSNYGRWELNFAEAGRYRVEAFTPAPYGMSKKAVYKIHHGDSNSDIPVDQSAVNGWNLIGELDFVEGGHGQFVRVDDNTGEPNDSDTKIVFDALRFTRVDVDDDGDSTEDPSMADEQGCSAGGGKQGGALALLGLVLVRPRRRRRN